jgi:hypothetical protein
MILGVGLYPYFGLRGILFPLDRARLRPHRLDRRHRHREKRRRGRSDARAEPRLLVTSALAIVGFFIATHWLLQVDTARAPRATSAWLYFFFCGVIGI